ncbi:MAG TPA: hypothetical protein VK625_02900 [Flavitalea sp.]|nr:hypothetical protein [Flavitalea sp.]
MIKNFIQAFAILFLSIGGVEAQDTPRIQSALLNEISGLVASGGSDTIFYAVNDSGDSSRFFAVDTSGRLIATYHYKGSNPKFPLGVMDCEEMAWGPGKIKGKNYLYVGDIGDNRSIRPFITIFGFEEPQSGDTLSNLIRTVIHLKYLDHPRDAEAFLIDPLLKTICIISKREDTVGIYETTFLDNDLDTLTLEKKGILVLPRTIMQLTRQVVSTDISRDGTQLLIKTYGSIYYWKRKGMESIASLLKRKPLSLPYTVEPQGETIAFNRKGTGFYCISEGLNPVIYYYPLKQALETERERERGRRSE